MGPGGCSMIFVKSVSRNKWGPALLASAACGALFTAIAVAAVITPDPVGVDAGYVVVPVSLSVDGADEVSSALFELSFDPEVYELVDVFAGVAADDAGKEVQYAAQGIGVVRVLVSGMNQDAMDSGTLARVYLKPLGAKQSNDTFSVGRSLLSDPHGQPVDDALQDFHVPETTTEESTTETSDQTDQTDRTDLVASTTSESSTSLTTGENTGDDRVVLPWLNGPSGGIADGQSNTKGMSAKNTTTRAGTSRSLPASAQPPARPRLVPGAESAADPPAPSPYLRSGVRDDGELAGTHLALNIGPNRAFEAATAPEVWPVAESPRRSRGSAATVTALAAGFLAFIVILAVRAYVFAGPPSRRRAR